MSQAMVVQDRLTNANSDQQLIDLWLADKQARSEATRYLYELTVRQFWEVVPKSLGQVRLEDLRAYERTLDRYRPATRAQRIATIKSLLSFAHRVGYTTFNVGAAIKPEMSKDTLSERILTEDQVEMMIEKTTSPKEKLLLRLLYVTGGRVSEITGLTWGDFTVRDGEFDQVNEDQGVKGKQIAQVRLFGKGKKTRYVVISKKLHHDLLEILGNGADNDKVFGWGRFRVWQIVKKAGKRVGIAGASPHWLRHAHATHALGRGAPLKLVSETLGHSSILITDRYLHIRPEESSGNFLKIE